MAETQPTIRHVSDTARWSAVYRARESERKDALFNDPYARALAGKRGEEIASSLPFHEQNSWSWVARTWGFDKLIREQLAQGTDLVINLAAGLDARPYRMDVPASLRWVEIDLPGILDYKESILANDRPRCQLQQIRFDLADAAKRRELLKDIVGSSKRALIISEGLLVYLSAQQVGELADDLAAIPAIQNWIIDIASPGLLEMLKKFTNAQFDSVVTPLQFAPENGPDFFLPHGWKAVEILSALKTAAKLKRLPKLMLKFFSLFPEHPTRMGKRPWSGFCLLGRNT